MMELSPSRLLDFDKVQRRQSNFCLQIHISVPTSKTKLLAFILSSLTLKVILKVIAVTKRKKYKASTMCMNSYSFR